MSDLANLSLDELTTKLQKGDISALEFQNAIEAQKQADLLKGNLGIAHIKVSEKGCLTVRLKSQRQFPTSLYATQWVQLLLNLGEVVDALYANRNKLSFKDGQSLPDREFLEASILASLRDEGREAA